MLIYDNEYGTKENKNWTKDKIELQHIYMYSSYPIRVLLDSSSLKKKNNTPEFRPVFISLILPSISIQIV